MYFLYDMLKCCKYLTVTRLPDFMVWLLAGMGAGFGKV